MKLRGIFAPLTTPFNGDHVAADRLAANIARYERHGLAGYLLLGSTGEAALLAESERDEVLAAARAAIPAGKLMLAGVGRESTAATVRAAHRAAKHGASAALVVTPSYFRAQMSGPALERHFATVADASPLPVLLYNVPQFTGVTIPPETVGRLADHPNIIGLKDSAGDLAWLGDVLARVSPSFQVLCGAASVVAEALAAGAVGGILALADAVPEPCLALYAHHVAGRAAEATGLQERLAPVLAKVIGTAGVAGVKAAMDARGLAGGAPRPPLLPLPAAAAAEQGGFLASLVEEGMLQTLRL